MSIYLPPHIAEAERRRFAADILRRVTVEDARAREFTAKLQRIDSRLFMVKAYDKIEPGTPLVPGYYHVLARNEGAPMSVFVVHLNGAYVEPDSRVFDRLAAGDLRDPRKLHQIRIAEEAAQSAIERDKAREADDRHDELDDRVNAATRTQVSLDRTLPWSQNSAGRTRNGRG